MNFIKIYLVFFFALSAFAEPPIPDPSQLPPAALRLA
jgi:hypothetical protein